jgi:hypothetical protein
MANKTVTIDLALKRFNPDKSDFKALGAEFGPTDERPILVQFEVDKTHVLYNEPDYVILSPEGLAQIGRRMLDLSKIVDWEFETWAREASRQHNK